ncbi:MAG: division/cell wall cluster transcriptional repressor MraZ [Gammaproteobacteria bacterium]
MFRGINSINVDQKGRIAIPVRYRQTLLEKAQGQMIITIDTEQRCLLLFPLTIWEEIEQKIAKLPSFSPATRRIQRLLIGHATELALDSHGRILLPPLLRKYANIQKKLMLVGQGNKFELWNNEQWQQQRDHWLNSELVKEGEIPEELKDIAL